MLPMEWFTISNSKWYLNSGCSKARDQWQDFVLLFHSQERRLYLIWWQQRWRIIGIGIIGKFLNSTIFLVKGLKHNLLNISHLCDKGNNVTFNSSRCRLSNLNLIKQFLPTLEVETLVPWIWARFFQMMLVF